MKYKEPRNESISDLCYPSSVVTAVAVGVEN